MLRLYHHQTGRPVSVRPARRGELRTYTLGPADGEPVRLSDLRCYLLSDLIRRVAELHHLQVSAWQNVPRGSGGPITGSSQAVADTGQALHPACDALNIYPAQFSVQSPEPLDIGIGPPGGSPADSSSPAAGSSPADGSPAGEPAAHWVSAAHVLFADHQPGHRPGAVGVADLVARGADPLALRLAFLRGRYREPLTLSWDSLAAASAWLRQWRDQVARWACSPSKPMSARHVAEVSAAFDDDLGTPAALRSLAALAGDGGVPPGAKFETFAHLDRLLGLDLAREVGR